MIVTVARSGAIKTLTNTLSTALQDAREYIESSHDRSWETQWLYRLRVVTNERPIHVPSAYEPGYCTARLVDPSAADHYIRHTTIGDPRLDPVMEEIADLSPSALHRFLRAGINCHADQLSHAPKVLRDFFEEIENVPDWFDYSACNEGIRAFSANANFILVAFVAGVLIEGFASLIATSFNITQRTVSGPGDRRLKQNNRQLIEIFLPGGLHRYGDGWKLSVRVRFVHALGLSEKT